MVSDMGKTTIINLHSKGLSKRKIANTLGIARNTAKRYIGEYEEAKARIEAAEDPVGKARIQKSALEAPRVFGGGLERSFNESFARPTERREEALGPSANRWLNSAVLHRQLLSEGFEVSGRTIRSKLAKRKGKGREVFIRQSYECGERADFDFRQAKVTIAGSPRVVHQATISRPASNHVFVALCEDETIASVEKALIAFFEECGGVFGEVAFDNLKPVVARIGRRRAEKAYTDEITRFAAYYGFSINACNPARGNEKGHVGNSGKNARAELFSTVCEFAAREGMEAHRDRAMAGCNRRSAAGFAKERPALRPLPGSRYAVARFGEAKANKYSLISVMSNFCSVPEGLAGERVEWEAINGELVVLDRGAVVARHRLLDGKGRYSVEIRHCLETLRRKSGALARSLALRQGDEGLAAAYEARHKGDPSGFIDFFSGASEPTDRGKRIAEASIAQLRRIGENVTARRRRWISRGWPRPLG